MALYNHILLATGLAEHAEVVAEKAKAFADKHQAKLSLVHVIEHTSLVYGSGEYSIPIDVSIEEQLTKTAHDALATIASKLEMTSDNIYLLHGSAKDEVTKLAEKIQADLIIVGTHARFGVELLLGSTANAILHAAKCDVYAVNTRP